MMRECTFLGDGLPPQPQPCARQGCGNRLLPNDTCWRDDYCVSTDLFCSPSCFGIEHPKDEGYLQWKRSAPRPLEPRRPVEPHPTDAAEPDTW